MAKNTIDWIALVLLIIGGVVWGLIAINPLWNVVDSLGPMISRIVYALVGLSAIYTIYYLFKE